MLLIWLLATKVFACECDSTISWQSPFDNANVVVLGTCIDVTTNPIKGGLNVLFEVDSSWKRGIEPIATFHSDPPEQCGFDFRRGEKYIVFGKKRHQTIETTSCLPNQAMSDNGPLTLRRLGQGFSPGRPGLMRNMNLMLLALGVLGLAFVAFVVLRKKRK